MRPRLGPGWARALAALLVGAALLLTGCEGDGDAEPAEAATSQERAGEGDARAEPEPAGGAPLTGLPLDEAEAEEVAERPVVAVKVDNAPAARPQEGLGEAEIVFVEPVEGGLTRFVALYHAAHPERVGPVRSAREADAELLPTFDPVFGYSGAAPPVLAELEAAEMALREEGQPADAWGRDPSRQAPHNLFAVPAKLPSDLSGPSPAERPWPISEPGPDESGEDVDEVTLCYSAAAEVGWAWDGERGAWVRTQDSEPHVAASGERVAAANVVVAQVDVAEGGRTDAAGNPVVDMTLEGAGPALVLSGGRAVEARWEREAGGQYAWTTADGEPLPLAPGRTWVELVPRGSGAVDTHPPEVG